MTGVTGAAPEFPQAGAPFSIRRRAPETTVGSSASISAVRFSLRNRVSASGPHISSPFSGHHPNIRSKITVSQRYDVPERILQGGAGGEAHFVQGQKSGSNKVVKCCWTRKRRLLSQCRVRQVAVSGVAVVFKRAASQLGQLRV